MGKFKTKFLKDVKEERQRQAEQKRLHQKHKEIDQNVAIVETDNMLKFTVRNLVALIRITATIAILILAVLGLLALIYPDVRLELLTVLQNILRETKSLIGL